jgi:hypothetical protein
MLEDKKMNEQLFRTIMATFNSDQIGGLSSDQISWLSSDQIGGLSSDQISWLSSDQISWLSSDQIGGLSSDQISWLSSDQIGGLSSDQISWLSPEAVKKDKELWESVPKVDRLYSGILASVQADGLLDQSTFGPEEYFTVCSTPMCIAGWTVHAAGPKGHQLKARYGFATAAALIHAKSRPDVSRPRYDDYPNEWALAYIETRAAEESKQ